MEFRNIFLLAWENKKKLIIIPLLIVLLTLYILQLQPAIYEARGSVEIKGRSLAPWLNSDDRAAVENEFAKTYSYMMNLHPFLNDVSRRLQFEEESIVFEQALKIDYTKDSNVIMVSARLKNPEQAAQLVNSIIDYFPLYLNKIQIAQPVAINVREKAEVPVEPLSPKKVYFLLIAVCVSFFWILNIIMFSNCLKREFDYERTI